MQEASFSVYVVLLMKEMNIHPKHRALSLPNKLA